jgi:pimeloyl-ACP methyl ester carboxylesterase
VHHVAHGTGRPVVVLHGVGVDHRETEACFEPAFESVPGYRRIYPDLPGMGRTPATGIDSADDVVRALLDFVDEMAEGERCLLAGHSAGAYFAQTMAARVPDRVAGLALVCPMIPGARDVPEHRVVAGPGDLGDEEFRRYFVVQTQEMLDRYERYDVPGMQLVDEAAVNRIFAGGDMPPPDGAAYDGPTLVVAGRLDSAVGYAAAVDLALTYQRASLAVLDDAGHALPHEQPEVLRALVRDWLGRADR